MAVGFGAGVADRLTTSGGGIGGVEAGQAKAAEGGVIGGAKWTGFGG